MQLAYEVQQGEKVTTRERSEVGRLLERKRGVASDRSLCLHCGRQLKWYELIPIASWCIQAGRCRSCRKPIGYMEILAELVLAAGFVVSYVVWPFGFETTQGVVYFVIWLLVMVGLAIHWMYDTKWFLLLDRVTIYILCLASLFVAFRLADQPTALLGGSIISIGLTLLVLPGFYGLLHALSRGAWVGLGDVKLLVPFALMLPGWEEGVLLIFLANLIGCLVLLPGMITKRLTRTTRVPFGPFLILAFVVTFLFGERIVDFYVASMLF